MRGLAVSSSSAVEALRKSREEDSKRKQQQAKSATEALIAEGMLVNVSAVARRAGVSREFIYAHQDLLKGVEKAREQTQAEQPATPATSSDQQGRYIGRGIRADRATLADQVRRLRARLEERDIELGDLRQQRQRWLGDQLTSADVNPEVHDELRITNERLTTDNMALRRRLSELRRLNTTLEADLSASRQSHTETIAALSAD